MGPSWKLIGDLTGASTGRLDAIAAQRQGNVTECCRDVFLDWFQQGGKREYPVTWDGVIKLLDDIQHSALARRLEEILKLV